MQLRISKVLTDEKLRACNHGCVWNSRLFRLFVAYSIKVVVILRGVIKTLLAGDARYALHGLYLVPHFQQYHTLPWMTATLRFAGCVCLQSGDFVNPATLNHSILIATVSDKVKTKRHLLVHQLCDAASINKQSASHDRSVHHSPGLTHFG